MRDLNGAAQYTMQWRINGGGARYLCFALEVSQKWNGAGVAGSSVPNCLDKTL